MRLRSRKILFALLVLVLLAAFPLGYLQYQAWQTEQELTQLVAELDRTAGPWRLSDLEARRTALPDERNAAVHIKNLQFPAEWKLYAELEKFRPAPNQVLGPDHAALLRNYLDEHEDKIQTARQLSKLPEGRFTIKYSDDMISTLLPHMDLIRNVRFALRFDMQWHTQQGNFEHVAQSWQAAVNAARTLCDEPILISQLVRLASLLDAALMLERMLAQGTPPPALLPPLQRVLLEEADFDGFTVALEGERAGMHQLFEHLRKNPVNGQLLRGLAGYKQDVVPTWLTDRFTAASAPQSHVWLLRHLTEGLKAGKLPPLERAAKRKELNDDLAKAPALAQLVMSPVFRRSFSAFERSEAKLRCAAVACAAEQFRQQHDRWPTTMEELTPKYLAALQLDPCHGTPLQLRPTADGIVIYSTGPEGNLRGEMRDAPPAVDGDPKGHTDYEFRLWNKNRRRVL